MSKHVPDTAAANAGPGTMREAARRDHKPYQVRPLDEIEWETIRWPGETGTILFHPRPEDPTQPNAGILRREPARAWHPEPCHGFTQAWLVLKGDFVIDGRTCTPGAMLYHPDAPLDGLEVKPQLKFTMLTGCLPLDRAGQVYFATKASI